MGKYGACDCSDKEIYLNIIANELAEANRLKIIELMLKSEEAVKQGFINSATYGNIINDLEDKA